MKSENQLRSYPTNGNAREISCNGDLLYVANGIGGLRIIDISDVYNIVEKSQFQLNARSYSLDVKNGIVLVATNLGIKAVIN